MNDYENILKLKPWYKLRGSNLVLDNYDMLADRIIEDYEYKNKPLHILELKKFIKNYLAGNYRLWHINKIIRCIKSKSKIF
jgi:hypothetical protein